MGGGGGGGGGQRKEAEGGVRWSSTASLTFLSLSSTSLSRPVSKTINHPSGRPSCFLHPPPIFFSFASWGTGGEEEGGEGREEGRGRVTVHYVHYLSRAFKVLFSTVITETSSYRSQPMAKSSGEAGGSQRELHT